MHKKQQKVEEEALHANIAVMATPPGAKAGDLRNTQEGVPDLRIYDSLGVEVFSGGTVDTGHVQLRGTGEQQSPAGLTTWVQDVPMGTLNPAPTETAVVSTLVVDQINPTSGLPIQQMIVILQ